MGIGESIKKGFSVGSKSGSLFLVLFIFGLAFNLINVFLFGVNPANPTTPPQPPLMAAALGLAFVFILLSIYMQGGTLGYLRDKIKVGQTAFSVFFASGAKYYLRLLLVGILIALVVVALLVLAGLFAAILTGSLAILGIILAIVVAALGIYFVILMFFAPYIIVIGEQKPIAAIKQSITFVRKNLLGLLGIVLLLVLVGLAVGFVLGALSAVLMIGFKGMVPQLIFGVLSSAINAYLGILVTAIFMTFYLGRSAVPSEVK